MSRLRILMILAAGACFSANALGQECPPSIELMETMSAEIKDWNAGKATSKHLLAGVDVVDGELHVDDSDNALLKPQTLSADEHIWKFRGPMGSKVAWMLCTYRSTGIRLTRRIDSAATECREKIARSAAPGGEPVVRGSCGAAPAKGASPR